MKVLWLTGALLPEATAAIRGEAIQKWSTTGSWILGGAAAIARMEGVELYMAATSQEVTTLTRVETGDIVSYAIPYGKGHYKENKAYEPYMKAIHDEIGPDVVHIHGTEYTHGLAYLRVCGGRNVVISIQGLLLPCSQYYYAGMSFWEIAKNISFRDIIRGGIFHERNAFRKRGKLEQEMLRSVSHVIGRTSWDHAHAKAVNPDAKYHHGGETLRPPFYGGDKWAYHRCIPHTMLFISGYTAPFKGLHQLLKAMPLILREYPDAKIKVCGPDPTLRNSPSKWWRIKGYGRYIESLIGELQLANHISFLGPKDAEGIKAEFLSTNVYVCPSSIENSPNSIGEAQILGVPHVAAFVGGVADMMRGNEDNLYRFEEVEMLAVKVCDVFANSDRQPDMASIAAARHDPSRNASELMHTYADMLSLHNGS